jgi:hypothetical protein
MLTIAASTSSSCARARVATTSETRSARPARATSSRRRRSRVVGVLAVSAPRAARRGVVATRAASGGGDASETTTTTTSRTTTTTTLVSLAGSATLACAYAALVYFAGCNAFMWALDLSAPIIETPAPFVLGRLFVAIGMTALAAFNFYPQAKKQLGLAARAALWTPSADAETKTFAMTFAAKVCGKIMIECVAYWYALTMFTPCSVSMELCAYYGVAFVGHAAFMASSARVLGASGAIETIPRNVRALIGSFDLVLGALCVATSRFAMAGWGVASAACGAAFLALALYFTFENKQKPSDSVAAVVDPVARA